jgi:signal transduction histidine kinase
MTSSPPPPARIALARFEDHPLEMFAWARRFRRSALRDLVYTFVFNAMIAGVFTLFALPFTSATLWPRVLWTNLVFANCIGYTIHVLFASLEWLTDKRCYQWGFGARAAVFGGIPIVGVVVGYLIGFELVDWKRGRSLVYTPEGLVAIVGVSIVITGILAAIMSAREGMARAEAAYEAERARVATAERAAALASLKALEAQVEPHFLYNTLAHVASLIDAEPAGAKRMLDRLIVLLRASAAGSSSDLSTLGAQLAHVRAYLEVLAMRMGPRLRWSIDASGALAARELPPAILQPLVENAIKHGIEPALDGGTLAIAARDEGGRLVLEVADTGVGFGAAAAPIGGSTGLGLANLRARLAALYGDEARVTIAENAPRGVRVAVSLPAGGLR